MVGSPDLFSEKAMFTYMPDFVPHDWLGSDHHVKTEGTRMQAVFVVYAIDEKTVSKAANSLKGRHGN